LFTLAFYGICSWIAYRVVVWILSFVAADNIKSKSVFITGCDTGFGHMLALQLADAGLTVFAGCLTEAGEAELHEKQQKKGTSCKLIPLRLDVSSLESVEQAFEIVKKQLPSNDGLWALVNNAGVLRGGNLETQPISAWTLQLNVNVVGIASMTKTFLPLLRTAKGRVINIASVAGRLGTSGTSSYNASKFAVEGLSDAWRRELKIWGIKVIVIEPGIMKTPLWDQPFKDADTDTIWKTLTTEQQQVYGREYFAEAYNAGKDLVTKVGGNPQLVVNAMHTAVTSKWPEPRVAVGYDTPLWLLFASLPVCIADPLLALVVKQPLPAALRK